MAQTANNKKQPPAIDRYNKCSLVKQRLIWLYYHGEQTNNQERLSPEGVVGGISDRAIAGNVKQYIAVDRSTYQAKVSSSLISCLLLCVVSPLIFCLFCRQPAKSL